ncbi:12435_t:CDS:2, partial [Gigaspora rosea]
MSAKAKIKNVTTINMEKTEAREKVGTWDTEVTDDATLVELEPSFPEDTI